MVVHGTGAEPPLLQADVHVDGVMGTSSGALAGSLYAAGYSPQQVSIYGM